MKLPQNQDFYNYQKNYYRQHKNYALDLHSPYEKELHFMNHVRQKKNFILGRKNMYKNQKNQIGSIYNNYFKTDQKRSKKQLNIFRKVPSQIPPIRLGNVLDQQQQSQKQNNKNTSLFILIGSNLFKQFMREGLTVYANDNKFQKYPDLQKKICQYLNKDAIDFQSQFILFIHPKMFPLYRAYHKILSIKQQKIQLNRTYSIITFKGIAYSGDSICFGIAICQNITQKKAGLIFMKFQKEHTIAPSTVILSKDQIQICKIAQNYFRTCHPRTNIKYKQTTTSPSYRPFVNDSTYKICNYYTTSITQLQRRRIKSILLSIRKNPNYKIKGDHIRKVFNYQYFHQNNSYLSQNVCFFGTNLDIVVKYIDNSVKQRLKQELQLRLSWIIDQQLQIIRNERAKLIQRQQFQKFYNIKPIYYIKTLLSKKTFSKFMLSTVLIPKLTISIALFPHFYIVQNGQWSNIVKFNTPRALPPLLCDCKMQERTGLPCEHIIKVAINQQIQLLDCIDQFWLVDQFNQEKYTANRYWEVFKTKD